MWSVGDLLNDGIGPYPPRVGGVEWGIVATLRFSDLIFFKFYLFLFLQKIVTNMLIKKVLPPLPTRILIRVRPCGTLCGF